MTAKTSMTDDEQQLTKLQADFPNWRIWRTRDGDVPAWWAATRLDPAAGPSATVMDTTAENLRAQLLDQTQRAASGELIFDATAGDLLYGGGK